MGMDRFGCGTVRYPGAGDEIPSAGVGLAFFVSLWQAAAHESQA